MVSPNFFLILGRLVLGLSLVASIATLYMMFTSSGGDRPTLLATAMLWLSVGVLGYLVATMEARGGGDSGDSQG